MHLLKAQLVAMGTLLAACSSPPISGELNPEADGGEGGSRGGAPGGGADAPPRVSESCEPANVSGLRVLSAREYEQSLRAVFGSSAAAAAPLIEEHRGRFDTEVNRTGGASQALIERLAANAKAVATQFAASADISPCDARVQVTAVCANNLIDQLAPRLWKRPVANAERATLLALFERTRGRAGDRQAVESIIVPLLLSPDFLLHIAVGGRPVDDTDRRWLAPHELAHRLAYALWGEPADLKLLQSAAAGNLDHPQLLQATVHRMLADPRSRAGVFAFYSQWLGLDKLQQKTKDPKRFPQWNKTLIDEAQTEVSQFVNANFFGADGNLQDLLMSRAAVVGPNLASVYGVRSSGDASFALPEGERAGILTRVAFLAGHSHSQGTSPSSSGTALLNAFLCAGLPPPPANVDFVLPDNVSPPLTRRQSLERMLNANSNCAACHSLIDPLGFPFDGYDAVGVRQTTDNGLPIDTTGAFTFHREEGSLMGAWKNAIELSRWLSEQPVVKDCAADTYWQYLSGAPNGLPTNCSEQRLRKVNVRGSMKSVVLAAVTDEAFRQVRATIKAEPNATLVPLPEADTAFEAALIISANAFSNLSDRLLESNDRELISQWQHQFEELRRAPVAIRP